MGLICGHSSILPGQTMAVNIRKTFKRACGRDVSFVSSRMDMRGEHRVVVVRFARGGKVYDLDGVIHHGNTPDERLRNAVERIAGIASNLRSTLAGHDGAGQISIPGGAHGRA